MHLSTTSQKLAFSALIVLSLALLVMWCFLSAGYHGATGIRDSRGFVLGFNDPLTWELVKMILARTSLMTVIKGASPFSLACAVSHGIGLAMIWLPVVSQNACGWFFTLQSVLFPQGILGLLLWVFTLCGTPDGESIVDSPESAMAAAPWILISWLFLLIGLLRKQTDTFTTISNSVHSTP